MPDSAVPSLPHVDKGVGILRITDATDDKGVSVLDKFQK